MIERTGTYTCERCGKSFDWVARMRDSNSITVSRVEDYSSKNIRFFGIQNGRLIATGKCPHCGFVQMKNLVDEEWKG